MQSDSARCARCSRREVLIGLLDYFRIIPSLLSGEGPLQLVPRLVIHLPAFFLELRQSSYHRTRDGIRGSWVLGLVGAASQLQGKSRSSRE